MTWRPGNAGKEEENQFDLENDEKMRPLCEQEVEVEADGVDTSAAITALQTAAALLGMGGAINLPSLAPLIPAEMNNPIELEPGNKSGNGQQKQHRHDDEPFSVAALTNLWRRL